MNITKDIIKYISLVYRNNKLNINYVYSNFVVIYTMMSSTLLPTQIDLLPFHPAFQSIFGHTNPKKTQFLKIISNSFCFHPKIIICTYIFTIQSAKTKFICFSALNSNMLCQIFLFSALLLLLLTFNLQSKYHVL